MRDKKIRGGQEKMKFYNVIRGLGTLSVLLGIIGFFIPNLPNIQKSDAILFGFILFIFANTEELREAKKYE